jgi:hypothetical protein
MGNQMTQDLAESGLDLDTALRVHLSANHYPPVDAVFIPVAKKAIALAEKGEWEAELTYPNGLVRSVAHTVEGLHLEWFIDDSEGE